MPITLKTTIHGIGEVPLASAIDIPTPIEFPAWKEDVTKNTPAPKNNTTALPHFCLMVVRKIR
jgi:hypothetical protein